MPLHHILQNGNYTLSHVDLHWDKSEHAEKGAKWDMEMQLNHFDMSYDSFEEAVKVPGATLTVGLFFTVSYVILLYSFDDIFQVCIEIATTQWDAQSLVHLKKT